MPLGAADLTRIVKYRAFQLGTTAGNALTYNEMVTLINQQISNINDVDAAQGTTFAAEIQVDLDRLDTLDAARNTTAREGSGSIKVLGRKDGIEYFKGGPQAGFTQEMELLRQRVARVLSQSYEDVDSGVSMAYRG
ncbi:MAG: hypothetical protein F6K00_19575 [Leptolyngbya sp. SIOISBB]|nr:hypothetical protein [Leptolyngbya sp. SIOISBB]